MIIDYHPHLCDLAEVVSNHGCGRIRNGQVIITKAKDSMPPKAGGFCVGSVGIWGIGDFKWSDNMLETRRYAAALIRALRTRKVQS